MRHSVRCGVPESELVIRWHRIVIHGSKRGLVSCARKTPSLRWNFHNSCQGLAVWLQDEGLGVDERLDLIESLPEQLALFELGGVLLPVMDAPSVPLSVRAAAIKAYATKGHVNPLMRIPSKPDPVVRRLVIEALDDIATRTRTPSKQKQWDQMTADLRCGDDEKTSLAIVNLSLRFGRDREALAILTDRLGDDDHEYRRAAACGLGFVSEFGPLIRRCHSGLEEYPQVRRMAAFYIGTYFTGTVGEAETLTLLLDDPDPAVVKEARKSLRALGMLPRATRKASTKGRPASDDPWSRLLQRVNDRWFRDDDYLLDLPDEVVEQGWLGYPPASPDQTAAAKERLGVDLPPSYRDFLAVSNGWRHVADAAGELIPVQSIDWFATKNQEWIDAYADSAEYRGLQQSILISDGSKAVILLATEVPGPEGSEYSAGWIMRGGIR